MKVGADPRPQALSPTVDRNLAGSTALVSGDDRAPATAIGKDQMIVKVDVATATKAIVAILC